MKNILKDLFFGLLAALWFSVAVAILLVIVRDSLN